MALSTLQRKKLQLAQFALPNNTLAYAILILDFSIYIGCITFAVLADHLALKFLFASIAGFFVAQLFVIGHDAAHAAYVTSRRANAIIARLTFMPALHNYTLWLFAHNRLHHAFPNVKNYNSWSPMSFEEFEALPAWRKLLERIYRSPAGFGPYYLIERWFSDKLLPRKHTPAKFHSGGWRDFSLNLFFAACLVSGVFALAMHAGQNPYIALLFAVVIPFVIWNYAIGLTIYQHHTHPQLPWYQNLVEWRDKVVSQSEVSIYIRYPKWYLFLTHNIYVHPVHHVNARIPLYRLQQAQTAYMIVFPELTHIIPFSVRDLMQTLKTCKLYDYTRHQWLDFSGKATTAVAMPATTTAKVATLRQYSGNHRSR
jgi:omega-6 fatty acid desaturase (delta-12 desaturase)